MFVVCGEALFDVFAKGRPAADGNVDLKGIVGGSPFNVAIGLARMSVAAGLLAGISRDMFGQALVARLDAETVSSRYVIRKDQPTTLSVVGLDASGSPTYAFYGDRGADVSVAAGDLPALGGDVTGLHFGSYTMVAGETARTQLQLAQRERQRFISYDPNIRLNVEPRREIWKAIIGEMLPLATVVKVSEEDIALLWPDQDAEELAADWSRCGPALVVLTRGGEGAVAFAGERRVAVKAPDVRMVDTVGAGDAFMAQMLAVLSEQALLSRGAIDRLSTEGLEQLLKRAVLAASMTCERQGADPPRKAEIDARLI